MYQSNSSSSYAVSASGMTHILGIHTILRCRRLFSKRLLHCCFSKQHVATRGISIRSTLSDFERIDSSVLVEEETVRDYKAEHCYPVKIGQLFHGRFNTIGKLGYGSASTVWLCRDLGRQNEYVALKVYINSTKVQRELPVYKHINSLRSEHQGGCNVRKLLESFEIERPHGKHICLVLQPLGISLGELRKLTPDGVFELDLISQTIRPILAGLQFLHREAHVIHTGELQPFETSLLSLIQNKIFNRTIYLSRPMSLTKGLPALSDLSEASLGIPNSPRTSCRTSTGRQKLFWACLGVTQSTSGVWGW